MKIFQFLTSDGNVVVKVDMLTTDLNSNATVMDVEYFITNTSMTTGYSRQQAVTNFLMAHKYFATVQSMPTSGAALKAIATTNNLTLNMYDPASQVNVDAAAGKTVLYASTTTTTTTAATTTTTTTAP